MNRRRVPLKSLDRQKRQGQYPYYGASGIVDYIDDFIFDGTYLLVSEDGENLRTRNTPIAFKASGKFWVNNHAHILEEKEDGILDYLEYYFSKLDLTPYITGAVQPKLNKANLDSVQIPIPEKEERLAINQVLNSITNKASLNRQTNQTLEQIAQAIFKSWFVDFEPVKAKQHVRALGGNDAQTERAAQAVIAGVVNLDIITTATDLSTLDQQLNEALSKKLAHQTKTQREQLTTTAKHFPDQLVESELGLIPEGWVPTTLSNMIRLIGGGTPKKSESKYWNGSIPWFSVKDAPGVGQVFVLDTELKITDAGLNGSSTRLLDEGTTIISARGTVGRLALVGVPMAMNQSCYGVAGADGIPPLFNYFNLQRAVDVLKQNTHGAVFDTITRETFDTVAQVAPSTDLINCFEETVTPLLNQVKCNVHAGRNLQQLRDALLPKLLSGELTVGQSTSPGMATNGWFDHQNAD